SEYEEFIDLITIFDSWEVNETIPFIRYKGIKTVAPLHKLYINNSKKVGKENSEIVSNELIPHNITKSWITDPVGMRRKRPTETELEYKISGSSLSFKLAMLKDETSNTYIHRYMTVNLYSDGKIELKATWTEDMGANINHI